MDCQVKVLENENTEAKLLEEEVDIKYPRGKIVLYDVSKKSSPIQSDVSNNRSPIQYDVSRNRPPIQHGDSTNKSPIQSDVSKNRSPVQSDVSKYRSSIHSNVFKNRSPVKPDVFIHRSPIQSDVSKSRYPIQSDISKTRSPIQSDVSVNNSRSKNQDNECHVRILDDEFLEEEQVGKEREGKRKIIVILAFLHLYFYNQLCVLAAWVWKYVAVPFWNWNRDVLCPFCYVLCVCLGLCIRLCTLGDP